MFLGSPDTEQEVTNVPYTNIVLSEEDRDSELRIALTYMVSATNELPQNAFCVNPWMHYSF